MTGGVAAGGVVAEARLQEAAPAKVNLSLRVVGKRADGYHLLDSAVVFAGAGDVVTAEPADDLSLRITGPQAALLVAEDDNLVLRAARALRDAAGLQVGARLTLDKHLPVASGIGGGSADAAAALRVLARLWHVPDNTDLQPVAAGLGADVPVCLALRPARMQGIGDVLSPLAALPDCGMVLVNPGVALATQAVFRARAAAFSPPSTPPAHWPDAAALAGWLAHEPNDLEPPAIALCPPVAQVLDALRAVPGCLLARMSGSGATCFALFATPGAARQAAQTLSRPGWWCWGGGLAG